MNSIFKIILFFWSIQLIFSSPVTFNVSTDRQDIHPGEYIKLIFDIDIENGFFIYSTNQEKSLSPTKVLWPDSTIFIDSSIFYEPEPKIKFDTNFEMDVGYHIGSVTLEQNFLTSKNLIQKNKINGKLFYQACDVKQCIRYYDDFELKLNICLNLQKFLRHSHYQ